MIALLIEALYCLVFLRALVTYVRHRDPLQRDVTLVFGALSMLLVPGVVERFDGPAPEAARYLAAAFLLATPYLTLRLVRQLRPVPALMMWGSVGLVLATAVALFVLGPLRPVALTLAVVLSFATVQTVAALLLATEACRRTGAARTRLILASAATALVGVALLTASAGTVSAQAGVAGRIAGYATALLSAVLCAVAFLPPRWLRRLWSGRASYEVHRELVRAPATEPPAETWRRYAETVRGVAGADAAVVLLPVDGRTSRVATAGTLPEATIDASAADLDHLLARRQPIDVPAPGAPTEAPGAGVLAFARQAGARIVVAVALQLPTGGQGALLLLARHRMLFIEDEVRLLGDLGAQAAILAERGAARAEQERLATELAASVRALSAASQAKTDFLANMSHELRTPLNAIIGFSELMRSEPEGTDQHRLVPDEWIGHVYASGHHLLGLINDILDLAKIEAGRMELRPELLDLSAVVGEAVTTLRPLIGAKRLRLTTVVPPLTIRADRTRIRQILDNLLSNAIKFTPEQGRILVAATDTGGDIQITVADTGPGIAADDQQRVFEEFQQVGDPIMHLEGTGLGLALTRRLVQAHGGSIELESELARGSRFTVHLPNLAPRTDRDGTDTAIGSRAEILLIEDEPSSAGLLRTYLRSAGYSVALALSGEEGVALAHQRPPDAVLLDVQLPGIDGWEVLRRFKRDATLESVPVFMVTVVDEREVGLALGAVDYFVKPIDRHVLLARLAERLVPPSADDETHILAIDDDPATLDVIQTSLSQQGFRVVATTSGQDGLRLARTRTFDLIITDLVMPDLDGLTLVGALDNDPATCEVPVLVLTAQDLTETDRADLGGKVLGILPKGYAVRDALREWLAHDTSPLRAASAPPRAARPARAGTGGRLVNANPNERQHRV